MIGMTSCSLYKGMTIDNSIFRCLSGSEDHFSTNAFMEHDLFVKYEINRRHGRCSADLCCRKSHDGKRDKGGVKTGIDCPAQDHSAYVSRNGCVMRANTAE